MLFTSAAFASIAAAVASTPPPAASMLVANVNDSRSHGVLGDAFLSLDEAIRLVNGSLMLGMLSTQERAQVVGMGTMVDGIAIDVMLTSTITLEAPLTAVTGMPGMPVMIEGRGMHGNLPTLQGGSHASVLQLRTHEVQVMGLRLVGGQVGIDVRTANGGVAMNQMAMVMDCELDGQAVAGIKVHGAAGDRSSLMVMHTSLRNMPTGWLLDDQTVGGFLMCESEWITMDAVGIGCDVVENGRGNVSMWMIWRSTFQNGATFARMRRPVGSTQQFMFRFVHCDAHCTGDVTDLQGSASGMTMVHHHHSDFIAGPGAKAFYVWPRTAEFDIHGSEMVFDGDVSIAANLFSQRIWQQNNQFRNGAVTIDVDGAAPNMVWNRYENCSLSVPATARTPVLIRQSEFFATNVAGNSMLAPLTLDGCYRNGGLVNGQVFQPNAVSVPFLGTSTVLPTEPRLGTTVQLSTDLPAGVGAIWDAVISFPRPVTTQEPVRFYGDPATLTVLPGMVVFQNTTNIPVPNRPILVGLEYYFQAVVVPLFQQPWAPPYHLPRGGLVRPVF